MPLNVILPTTPRRPRWSGFLRRAHPGMAL